MTGSVRDCWVLRFHESRGCQAVRGWTARCRKARSDYGSL